MQAIKVFKFINKDVNDHAIIRHASTLKGISGLRYDVNRINGPQHGKLVQSNVNIAAIKDNERIKKWRLDML